MTYAKDRILTSQPRSYEPVQIKNTAGKIGFKYFLIAIFSGLIFLAGIMVGIGELLKWWG